MFLVGADDFSDEFVPDDVGILEADETDAVDIGKGLDGLVKKGPDYYNPVEDALKAELGLGKAGAGAAGAAAPRK